MARVEKKESKQEVQKVQPARTLSPFEEMERLFEGYFPRGWPSPFHWERPSWGELAGPFEGKMPRVDIVDRARRCFDGYAKRFKFIIGHDIGKLEICGRIGDKLVLKQLHARNGHEEEISRLLVRRLTDSGGWLDDLPEATL